MPNQKGFIGFPILVAIVLLGLVLLGSGAYFVMHQNAMQRTPPYQETIKPQSATQPTTNVPSQTTQSQNSQVQSPSAPISQTSSKAGSGAVTPPHNPATFPSGIYYIQPALDHPGGDIHLLDGTMPVPVSFNGIGFDISHNAIITADDDTLIASSPDGSQPRRIRVPGLYAMARPSLSPDGKFVAVQATETPISPTSNRPEFITVYIVDLSNGTYTTLAPKSTNPMTGNELPEWFPSGDRIAHQGVENMCLVVKIYDVMTRSVLLTLRRDGTTGCYQPQRGIQDGTRFHLAVTPDNSRLLIVGQMQIYNTKTGALVADIHKEVMDALAAAGYRPDARYPGQSGGGTFPLDGTFSPDGTSIVFDGAAERNGTYGVLLMRVNTDGTGFSILKGPINVDPQFSNNNNFSELDPVWLK